MSLNLLSQEFQYLRFCYILYKDVSFAKLKNSKAFKIPEYEETDAFSKFLPKATILYL